MSQKRLDFLKDAFQKFEIRFDDNYSNAIIVNPNYDENIAVYDDEFEFIVYFSFQHRHIRSWTSIREEPNKCIQISS